MICKMCGKGYTGRDPLMCNPCLDATGTKEEVTSHISGSGEARVQPSLPKEMEAPDPNKMIFVLHLVNPFGKRETCRTVEAIENYVTNYKLMKSKPGRKCRDEDIPLQICFGRMTEIEYSRLPACHLFNEPVKENGK